VPGPRALHVSRVQALNTRLLLFAVVSTTLLQWTVMMAIDWSAESVVFLPGGQKVVVLLFQVVSTRTAGFQTIDYSACLPTPSSPRWLD
jgi:Trk-type K+ transport system membrane component